MRVEEAVVRQLQQPTSATYAIVGTRVYWVGTAKDPTLPFIQIRKAAHESIASGLKARRLPANATIEVLCKAKSQDGAADLADAVSLDLIGLIGLMPNTSPVTSGAIHVAQIEPGTEENLVSEAWIALNIFAESREYIVRYDQR